MLRGLDPLLSPDLLHALASMGHGDRIAIVDANYPAASGARRVVALPGIEATAALEAVLTVLPIDTFVDDPVLTMAVVGDSGLVPDVVHAFAATLAATGAPAPVAIDRFRFYDRARECFAVVQTGERRLYGNVILTKGVIGTPPAA